MHCFRHNTQSVVLVQVSSAIVNASLRGLGIKTVVGTEEAGNRCFVRRDVICLVVLHVFFVKVSRTIDNTTTIARLRQ